MAERTSPDPRSSTDQMAPPPDRAMRRCVRRQRVPSGEARPPGQASPDPRTRAAQYIRMSTDHQQYSPANQRDAIARYAHDHGLEVIRTYLDAGKSGLSVQGRDGLSALLDDVTEGRADYRAVLVYDVSRWGRFQDCDESAYYEYLCRRAGIRVEYCMEPFRNDGTPMSTVIKGLKRVMAGEYSRELSEKVFAGKCRLIRMGYLQGASAGYGLRRMVVDARGRPRAVLEHGQHKYIQSDRIVLVPGPPEELAVLRWMFRQVAHRGRKPAEIARALNSRGVRAPGDKPWTDQRVNGMLNNEKYIGHLVFNRFSTKLKARRLPNPQDQWVRVENAFPAVIEPGLFYKAQAAMARWSTRISNEAALDALRGLRERHGTLSAALINATKGMPGSVFYENRFGGLTCAYALAGYRPRRDYRYLEGYTQRHRQVAALRDEVSRRLRERGAVVERASRHVLVVNGGCRVGVLLGRCESGLAKPRWLVQIHAKPQPGWVLIARLDPQGSSIQDYILVRGGPQSFLLEVRHRKHRDRHQSSELDPLLDLIAGRQHASGGTTAAPGSPREDDGGGPIQPACADPARAQPP